MADKMANKHKRYWRESDQGFPVQICKRSILEKDPSAYLSNNPIMYLPFHKILHENEIIWNWRDLNCMPLSPSGFATARMDLLKVK